MRRLRILHLIAAPILALLAISLHAQGSDLEQNLRDQYKGKTVILRGFYAGEKLRYDPAGVLVTGAMSGDWTTEGFILLNDIQVSEARLKIKGKRLWVVMGKNGTFEFLSDTAKAQKKAPTFKIEADLPQVNSSFEQVDAILSKIFLSQQDSFAEAVPDYWKPCVPDGLSGKASRCFFSRAFGAIPGFTSAGQGNHSPSVAASPELAHGPLFKIGHGVSPPGAIFQHEPVFSEPAREVKYQGVVTLALVVSEKGLPININVTNPLGLGLDAKAVQAVETWRFKPAEKDGQPVATSLAVDVSFHLY